MLRSVSLVLLLASSASAAPVEPLPAAAVREDVALAREALERIHPGYERDPTLEAAMAEAAAGR